MSLSEIYSLLSEPVERYEDAKLKAAQIDQLLGFKIEYVEAQLKARVTGTKNKYWIGLDAQSFQTPYHELKQIVDHLRPQPKETWIDIGAGYGRLGIILFLFAPQVKFIGYEALYQRFNEGHRIYQNLGIMDQILMNCDVTESSTILEVADTYFIYDFSDRASVLAVLERLRLVAQGRSIKLISRGRGINNWIYQECPWLYLNEPVVFPTWTIFNT